MSHLRRPLSRRWLATLGASFAALMAVAWLIAPELHVLLGSAAVRSLDLAAWDRAHAPATPGVLWVARMSNDLHGTVGILVLTSIAAWIWHWRNEPQACMRLLVAVPAGMLLNMALKTVFDRARPSWAIGQLPLSASFPSGHVAEATVFYGSLAIETARRQSRRLWRTWCVAAAAAMIALVAFSRIVVGAHFLSDCIAALAESGLWLTACFSALPLACDAARSGAR
jgi:membrane-associated phospholipid phosphatase